MDDRYKIMYENYIKLKVKEFENLLSLSDKLCDLCPNTANHKVKMIKGLKLYLCERCFEFVLSIEVMLHKQV